VSCIGLGKDEEEDKDMKIKEKIGAIRGSCDYKKEFE